MIDLWNQLEGYKSSYELREQCGNKNTNLGHIL